MTKINNLNDFHNLTSNITSFSHAYLFDVNSLKEAFPYVKDFAKQIICEKIPNDLKKNIEYQIDNDEFDDLYVVNPSTIGISTIEIEKLLNYMETKSLREDGRRVYIIYGYERLSRDVSNKILKFLEEPSENIYALLMTENIERILSTIISRCQVINLTFDINKEENSNITNMKRFLECVMMKKEHAIAYVNNYFKDLMLDRNEFYNAFGVLEEIISNNLNKKCNGKYHEEFIDNYFEEQEINVLINILNITNRLKSLIKQNINLNLLLDRYIIELAKELVSCKK